MNKPLELLIQAQDKIRDPKNWTRDHYALDAEGNSVSRYSEAAVCFCSLGALEALFDGTDERESDVRRARDFLYDAAAMLTETQESVAQYNDTRTHAEVMAMWEKAKELAIVSAAP